MKIGSFTFLIVSILLACVTISCDDTPKWESSKADLPEIKERGKLRAITTYSSTSYFIYRGQPMGYEYELLHRLTEHLGLELEIVVAHNLDSLMIILNNGGGDIVAHGLTITKERKKKVAFTIPHMITHQVLVQRKPDNWRKMKLHEIEKTLIRNPHELMGKTVHVRENSAYYHRLKNLSEEVGEEINIEIVSGDLETEDIIEMVAEGEIEYTVADENIAMINATYHANIDVKTDISLPQRIAWAVRKSSPKLLNAVNLWIENMKKTSDYYVIYNKYFKNRRAFRRRLKSELFSRTGGKISKYDELIKEAASKLGWDWRLLASMIYQESRFNPNTGSWAGAKGLMQMMPATAKSFGVTNPYDPEQSIEGGTEYLKHLQDFWEEIPDSMERMKFVMASYNVGENHIADARRLADKYGANPDVWDGNVAEYILLKSKPKYYNDEVVEYGYCRGEEPYNYINEVLERYRHYVKLVS
ncbi:MAG: transporter substrate-binding domain-containing protein [candidate division Zixibacteria bacterium]|nr:transporter substrate-binding domain-containing protein [candidate division Zixibacteria bacterium]